MCRSDLHAFIPFALTHTCIWIPHISAAGEQLLAMWCWLCALVAQMCADGWQAMLACAPLTCMLCFLLPYPTHLSGSRLILQDVSERLAARHVVLVMCPSLPRCVLIAGRLCWHVPL